MCLDRKWAEVREIEIQNYGGNPATATSQTRQLQLFYESGRDVLWITFYHDHLYWCFVEEAVTRLNDGSRFRPTLQGWFNHDIAGDPLDVSRLSGSLLAVQGYRSTICNVREFEYLVRKINAESSPAEQRAVDAREALTQSLVAIIQGLHWKEFELLTDLIFRQVGWQRLGVLGKTTKDVDLDLLSPIDQERYKVQVKSAAGNQEFQSFLAMASDNQEFTRYYFVVHRPSVGLMKQSDNPLVKVWLPGDIARIAVNYGLVDWLIAKAK
jgi:hypothetical protein